MENAADININTNISKKKSIVFVKKSLSTHKELTKGIKSK
jgi:hypothetical protein